MENIYYTKDANIVWVDGLKIKDIGYDIKLPNNFYDYLDTLQFYIASEYFDENNNHVIKLTTYYNDSQEYQKT